jgi:hypothetical protein
MVDQQLVITLGQRDGLANRAGRDRPVMEAGPEAQAEQSAADGRRILAGTESQLDRDLAERLTALKLRENIHDECLEPLGKLAIEAVVWVCAATLLWAIAAVWSTRP